MDNIPERKPRTRDGKRKPPDGCKCKKPVVHLRGRNGSGKIRVSCRNCNKWGLIDDISRKVKNKLTRVNVRTNPIRSETGILQRAIVSPDKHFPLEDRPAMNCLKRIIEIANADTYIDLGDVVEGDSVSQYKTKVKGKIPLDYKIAEIDAEVKDIKARWDDIDEALDKSSITTKYLTVGNHDERFDRFVKKYEVLKDQYGFIPLFKVKERGYKPIPYGEMLKIGRLHFYHGHHAGGIFHARTHLLRFGINVIYGHHHSIQHYELGHIDGVKSATSLGCLKDLSGDANEWLKNLSHGWGHAVASVDWYDDGNYVTNIHRIIGGKTVFYGEYIDGNI